MPRVNALPHDALRILAAEQDGVVRRRQLHDLGISDDAVRARLLSGKGRLAARGLVVLHNGPPTELQKRWIALLANPGAALAGITSAQEYGLQGFDDGQLYLLVPHRYRAQRLQGVRIQESRRFDVNDIHPARSLPTVRAERALCFGFRQELAGGQATQLEEQRFQCFAVGQDLLLVRRNQEVRAGASRKLDVPLGPFDRDPSYIRLGHGNQAVQSKIVEVGAQIVDGRFGDDH